MSLRDIQSWWEIPCIAHFCSLFSNTLDLPQFEIEQFEQALLNDGPDASEDGSSPQPNLIPDLIVRLVNGCYNANSHKKSNLVTTSNYQMYLRRLFRKKCEEYNFENTFNEDIDFHSLPLRTKVRTLHRLCDFRLDALDAQPRIEELDPDCLRVDPLGQDSRGSTYWYFYGTRLYCETNRKVRIPENGRSSASAVKFRNEKEWQVICDTEDDWKELDKKFENSKKPDDIDFHNKLRDGFLDDIRKLFLKREKLRQQEILLANVRRSGRMVKPRILYETETRSRTASPIDLTLHTTDDNIVAASIEGSATPIDLSSTDEEDRVFGSEVDESSGTRRSLRKHRHHPRNRSRQTCKFTRDSPSFSSSPERSCVSTYNNDLLFQSSPAPNRRRPIIPHPNIVRYRSDTSDDSSSISSTVFNAQYHESKRVSHEIRLKKVFETNRSSHQAQTTTYEHNDKENLDKDGTNSDDSEHKNTLTTMAPTKTIPPPKVQGRRTNNSLSSLTENIFIPMPIVSVKTDPPAPPDKPVGKAADKSKNQRPPPSPFTDSSPEKMSSPSPPPRPPKKKKSKSGDVLPHTPTKKTTSTPPTNTNNTVLTNANTLSFTETEEVLQIGMHKVLEHVKAHKDAWPFVDPVEEDIAPRYYQIIRRPMDLLKMEEKLDNGEYQKFNDFRNDFKLIVNNCRLYNGQNNEYTFMVNHLQGAFEKATKKYFESNSSDDERNAEYPDLKTNVFREKNVNAKNVVPKPALLNELAAVKLKDAGMDSSQSSSAATDKSPNKKIKSKLIDTEAVSPRDDTTTPLPRGVKRKRKDKDKRRKKKAKDDSGKAVSVDEADEMEIDETIVSKPQPTKVVDSKADKNRRLFEEDDEDDDAWEYDKPPKHIKKKKKTGAASKKAATLAKLKNKVSKDVKPSKVKESSKKGKQKCNKKKEYSSEEMVSEDDHGREIKKIPKDESNSSKKTQRKKSLDKTKPVTKINKSNEKATASKPPRRDSESSYDTELLTKSASQKDPDVKLKKSVISVEEINDDRSITSDDALFDYPILHKPRSSDNLKRSVKQPKSKEQHNKKKSESTKSKRKSESKESKKSRNQPSRDRSPSPAIYRRSRSRSQSTTSSRSNSPKPFVDLHKKYSESASRIVLTPKKEEVHTKNKTKLGKSDLMSVSSGSRGSSPTPSHASYVDTTTQPTNHDRKESPSRRYSPSISPERPSIVAQRPITPEIRNKYDLIKERRSRNQDSEKTTDKVKKVTKNTTKSKDKIPSTPSRKSSALLSGQIVKNNALSETIEKLKANSKSSKKRTAILSEILCFKKSSEVRTEKEILEKLNPTPVKQPRNNEPKKKKGTPKKETQKPPAVASPPEDEYNFVDDLLVDPPATSIPDTTTKSAQTKQPRSNAPKKPRTNKNASLPVTTSAPVAPPKATNLEALELETEQTLKDINRWLEHTPRFDFNSASNSPTRYNLYDFDDVASKLEEEFQRPIVNSSSNSDLLEPISLPTTSSLDLITSSTPDANVPLDTDCPASPIPVTKVPDSIPTKTLPSVSSSPKTILPTTNSSTPIVATPVTTTHKTTQLIGMMPAPGSQKREAKEKKKSLKEKITGTSKRKETTNHTSKENTTNTHRGIDRLQPGKSKGNLLGIVKNDDHPEPTTALSGSNGPNSSSSLSSKPKEVKNSLMQPESDTGPKLSLGSVLGLSGFGLGNQHNFGDDDDDVDDKKVENVGATSDDVTKNSDDMDLEEIITTTDLQQKELEKSSNIDHDSKLSANDSSLKTSNTSSLSGKEDKKNEQKAADKPTPNLNAWFKAFGAPKKSKKAEEEEAAAVAAAAVASKRAEEEAEAEAAKTASIPNSPPTTDDNSSILPPGFQLPAPRTNRKASTGSTMSERSSYSQDPDSPRVGIEERLGGVGGIYPTTFPSPLSASPLTSPKDDLPKPVSPYPMNGALKVGFYQDTITKSSPEKSCSPREQPPTYSTYAPQHLYSTATASLPGSASYGNTMGIGCSYSTTNSTAEVQTPQATNQLGFNHSNKTPSYYDQYKQPRSQDSDYNSSMSPNPNSPYQQQLQSPYQQPGAASPYQQHTPQRTPTQHSPYHQTQSDGASGSSAAVANSPGFPGPNSPGFPGPISPGYNAQNSPYHQQNSPYAQPNSPVAATNLFNNQSPAAIEQPFSPTASPVDTTVPQQQSPFHSNPTSPYSPHQPQSPYQSAQSPMPKPVQSPMQATFNNAGTQDNLKNLNAIGLERSNTNVAHPLSPCAKPEDRANQDKPIGSAQQEAQLPTPPSAVDSSPSIPNNEQNNWPTQMPAMFNSLITRPEPDVDQNKPQPGGQLQSLDAPKSILESSNNTSLTNLVSSSNTSLSNPNPLIPAGNPIGSSPANSIMGLINQPYGGMVHDISQPQMGQQQQQQQTPQGTQNTPQDVHHQPSQQQPKQQQPSASPYGTLSDNKSQSQQMMQQSSQYSTLTDNKQAQHSPLQSQQTHHQQQQQTHQQPQPSHQQPQAHQQHQQYHHSHLLPTHPHHLHPPSAHNPYLQTYSNPYMDRHPDTALHQHITNQVPKHGYHQPLPSGTPSTQHSHPALHTPTLALPAGFDDSNSSAGSVTKSKSQSGDKSNETDTRSLETPRPQQQAHSSADLHMKQPLMYDLGQSPNSFNGAALNNQSSKRGSSSILDISTSKAYDMFNRAAMGFGGSTKPYSLSPTPPNTTSGTTHSMTQSSTTKPNLASTEHTNKMASWPTSKTDTGMMNMGYPGASTDPNTQKPIDKALNMSSGNGTGTTTSLTAMYQSHHMHNSSAPAIVTSANSVDSSISQSQQQHQHHNLHHLHQQHLSHQQSSQPPHHHQMHLQHQMMSAYGSGNTSSAPSTAPSSVPNQLSSSAAKLASVDLNVPNPNLGSNQPSAHQPQSHLAQHQHHSGHHQQLGTDKTPQHSPYDLNVSRYDMTGRQMPTTGMDPFKPFTSSSGNTSQLMLDAHTASMRSLLNMDPSSSSIQPTSNNMPSSYYSSSTNNAPATSKDMPPAAHMFSSKTSSMSAMMSSSQTTSNSNQSSATANLHQMLNNTMTMAYNATREQQQHQMHHQQQQQAQHHQPNMYGQHHQAAAPQAPVVPAAPVQDTKPKRTRKKKTPAPPPAAASTKQDTMQNQMLQHQQHLQQQPASSHHPQQHQHHHLQTQQGFQSYSHLKTNPTGRGSPSTAQSEPNVISLKTSANNPGSSSGASSSVTASSVPNMVPGSAFNFGPSGTGLGGLYGTPEGAPSYLDDFRNSTNPYYMPPAHRNTPDLSGGSGSTDKTPSAAAAAAAAAAVAATSVAAGGPSYHQFLSSRGSPYGFMSGSPSLDPNAQIYQSAQMRQMLLGPGILGHSAPAGYVLSPGYHPAMGMHKSPYDPMGQMNRPPWFQ